MRAYRIPLIALALLMALAVAAPLLPLPDPVRMDVAHRLVGAGPGHPFGQDEFGRDVLARLVWGARTSLGVALTSTAIACVLGSLLGLVGGFLRGITELLAVRSMDVVLCFPPLLLAILVVTLAGPGAATLIAVLSVLFLPGFVRVAYAGVLTARAQDYVEALRVLGAGNWRIMLRTILPNIAGPLLVQASLAAASAIVLETGLSFLGLGVVPPTPSWGLMIRAARQTMGQAPLLLLWPCIALTATILTFNALCDGLQAHLDPHARARSFWRRRVPALPPARPSEADGAALGGAAPEAAAALPSAVAGGQAAPTSLLAAGGSFAPGGASLVTGPVVPAEPAAIAGSTGQAGSSPVRQSLAPGVSPAIGKARSDAVIDIAGLTIELDTPAGPVRPVRDVSLHVLPGETLAIVGESGSGKSLTGLAVLGLLPPVARPIAGAVQFDGAELLRLGERGQRRLRGGKLAMVFQDPMSSLNPVHRVGGQIAETLAAHGAGSNRSCRTRVEALLRQVGIPDPARRARAFPHELSGGMRQRVMIAMAIANNPRLLIADEPTTALDVTVQAQVLELLAELKAGGLGMLFITHNLPLVAEIADRVAVMYAGEIVEQGPAEAVFARPLHPYTQALLRSAVAEIGEPAVAAGESVLADAGGSGRVVAAKTPDALEATAERSAFGETGQRSELVGPDQGSVETLERPASTIARPTPVGIPGSVPPPHALPPGCVFAPRCHLRIDACEAAHPALAEVAPFRQSRCIRWQIAA